MIMTTTDYFHPACHLSFKLCAHVARHKSNKHKDLHRETYSTFRIKLLLTLILNAHFLPRYLKFAAPTSVYMNDSLVLKTPSRCAADERRGRPSHRTPLKLSERGGHTLAVQNAVLRTTQSFKKLVVIYAL